MSVDTCRPDGIETEASRNDASQSSQLDGPFGFE